VVSVARPRKLVRKKRNRGSGRWTAAVAALVAAVVLAGLVLYLETIRRPAPEGKEARQAAGPRQKLPERVAEYPRGQAAYSTVSILPPAGKRLPKGGPGVVAIIIDDMGSSRHEVDRLLEIGVPLTFSIIPGLAHVRDVAEAAHRRGEEVMVHIPMEPKGVEHKPFEKNGLLLAMSDEELSRRLQGYLDVVPYADGANNHMGSRFTEDREKMRVVLALLKERKMFFVDSKTSPASVGDHLAREMGIRTAARNVFLDNVQDQDYIGKQIGQLVGMSRRNGAAIGICHPHKATIETLARMLPALRAEGVTFVHASDLVR
jgi:polysaccharide deacetylase 2 family uncharacterized protein YibQ